jgi:hypothetical protein
MRKSGGAAGGSVTVTVFDERNVCWVDPAVPTEIR